jgi:hypothetical protein
MENIQLVFQLFVVMLLLAFFSSLTLAKDSELKFRAAIAEINQPVEGDSRVIVSLLSGSSDFDILLIVNTDTKIESNGYKIELSELEAGDYVKVRAFFDVAGIVAEEIEFFTESCHRFHTKVDTQAGENNHSIVAKRRSE